MFNILHSIYIKSTIILSWCLGLENESDEKGILSGQVLMIYVCNGEACKKEMCK